MSKVFLNIPEEFEKIISCYEQESFDCVYRAIRHKGDLIPEDFYPTFADEKQRESSRNFAKKGGMTRTIIEQYEKKNEIGDYAVSLFTDRECIEKMFQRRNKDRFPVIAVGHTDIDKGKAHLDGNEHVSYFLFDYQNEEKNPYKDFKEDKDE